MKTKFRPSLARTRNFISDMLGEKPTKKALRQAERDLTKAADIIASGRWIQGALNDTVDGRKCFCAVGAIQNVTSNAKTRTAQARRQTLAVDLADSVTPQECVVSFNDKFGRKRHEVVAKLRLAARYANQLAA